jgi:N-acetyl-anhydromuramyl-L-alanine amidase AmpD
VKKFYTVDLQQIKKPTRPVQRVFIHCSASDNPAHDNAETMEDWHLERGFAQIGYHYFIKKDGTIQQGRDLEQVPAAQQGHNTGTIAICCHGLLKEEFTAEQRIALKALCWTLNARYRMGLTFHGHCEVSAKSCPVFDYKEWLGLDAGGRMP